ncbi:MAG TPA: AraC family transcriptional regulator [Chlorobaculum sp.]|nr:AraC family transcriptional regulator [Chlorobaculum sp.]
MDTIRNNDGKEITLNSLANKIARRSMDGNHSPLAIPALSFHRRENPSEPSSYIHEPGICLIVQGAKRVLLGEEAYVYDANHFLITSIGLPVVAQIIEASSERPYLGLKLALDHQVIAQLMIECSLPPPRTRQADRGMAVGEVSLPLLNAFLRLIDLLDQPEEIPIIAPLIEREICYRLLVSDQGLRLRQIVEADSRSHQIARSIAWLKENFTRQLRVDELAAYAGMSTSSLHHHFRSLTAMSPLQFQKWLRLQEARRLMLTEHEDAATAALRVGYESPSQFSREYSRLFGAPPLRDIRSLLAAG